MLLDSHKQTDGAQHATLYLQIPAVEVASAENAGAVCTEGRFDRLESFIRRPRRRANGWSRWRNAVRERNFSRAMPDRRSFVTWARAAPRPAWTSDAPTARTSRGRARSSGAQKAPRAESKARARITKYHSGISGSAPSRSDVG